MAGHNKWSKIKHKKAVTDAKKSKIFSKLVRYITVEAKKSNGLDSPGLRAAIEKAKKASMPQDNIERAIKKAQSSDKTMESITYEAYGPGGVGMIIETLTDNKNRTAPEIRHILTKNGHELGAIGSVSWSFKKELTPEGSEWIPNNTISVSDKDLDSLEKIVESLEDLDDVQEVFTNAE